MAIDRKNYDSYVNEKSPNSPMVRDLVWAFVIGGTICTLGQGFTALWKLAGLASLDAGAATSAPLIFLGALLTGLNVYDNIAKFVSAGIRAVRKSNPDIPVMIHLDNGGNNELYRRWFDNYVARGEDFDLIGLSYYPFWHGTMDQLMNNMNDIAERYHKDLIIAEVSMGYTMEDYKAYEKLSDSERKGYATRPALVEKIEFPMTREGQADFMRTLLARLETVAEHRARGFFWWEPAWIPVPGSGWATPASLEYMNDPGPCGNEWANQALFDYDGNVLPTLEVIRDYKEK